LIESLSLTKLESLTCEKIGKEDFGSSRNYRDSGNIISLALTTLPRPPCAWDAPRIKTPLKQHVLWQFLKADYAEQENRLIPISAIVGGPISGWIMSSISGRIGLANWQWLFLLEGIPSIAVGLLALALITDKPAEADWLNHREQQLVVADLEEDRRQAGPREHGFGKALKLPRVWLMVFIYFCGTSSNVTIGFFVPSIIRSLGVESTIKVGLLVITEP